MIGETVGVEEEFLLVDPVSGQPAPAAAEVIRQVPPGPWVVSPEFATTQVEVASGVCRSTPELGAQLAEARLGLAAAAAASGLRVVATGSPVLADAPPPLGEGPRVARVAGFYAEAIADYQACGCHVHVGAPDREEAVAVLNHLAPWLPTLSALSANSPLRRGRDSGYASLRLLDQSRFPTSGLPPWFDSAADYDRQVTRLLECGALADDRVTFWLVRLSPHLPTIEVRAADAVPESWEARLQAALVLALARAGAADLAEGRTAPRLDPQVAAAAVWAAARHGVRGPAVDPVRGEPTTAAEMVSAMLVRAAPALEEAGELDFARRALAALRLRGTGAELQRVALARGGPMEVLGTLADRVGAGVGWAVGGSRSAPRES